jgi:hypothetical protein
MLEPELCEVATTYLRLKADVGEMQLGDSQIPHSYCSYSDLLMEVLLVRLQPQVETVLEASLLPTHSYARLYRHGEELTPHQDRPACEVVLSLTLGRSPDQSWPLYLRGAGEAERIDLRVGDGVVYPGSAWEHWRPVYAGDWQAQLTLHYVRAKGPFANWVYDRRPGIGRHVGTRRL